MVWLVMLGGWHQQRRHQAGWIRELACWSRRRHYRGASRYRNPLSFLTPRCTQNIQHADDFKHGTAPPPDVASRASQAPPAPALPPHKKLFTHAICGKTFTAKYYVKRHHFGAGKGKYGCWHVNGEPPIP